VVCYHHARNRNSQLEQIDKTQVKIMPKKPTYEELEQRVKELENEALERKRVEEALRESEQRYRTLFEKIPYGDWLTDATGYCTYVSNSFLELTDMSLEQTQKFGWLHLLPPEAAEPTKEHWLHCVETGEYFEREHQFRAKDGKYRNVLAIGRPIKNDAGKIVKWVGLNLDITERKQAEEALRESEEKYRSLVESTEDSIYLVDRDSTYLFVNKKHLSRLGSPADKVIGRTYGEFHSLDDTKEFVGKLEEVFETGEAIHLEHRSVRDDKYFLCTLSPIKDPDGNTTSVTVVSKDITDRKQAEEALRESEMRFRELVKYAPTGIVEIDLVENRFISVNDIVSEYSGYTRDELLSMPPLDIFSEDSKALFLEREGKALSGEEIPELVEYRVKARDDHDTWVLANSRITLDNEGKPMTAIGILHDITERKRADEALKKSEERYRELVEDINDVLYTTDETGTITYITPRIESILGYSQSEGIGHSFVEFIHPDDLPHLAKRFQELLSGVLEPSEYRLVTKSGEIRWVRSSSRPILKHGRVAGIRGVLVDITESKRLQAHLQEASKVEAIATLAGGIAHQFNNALTSITGHSGLLEMEYPEDEKIMDYAKAMKQSAHRMAHLTSQLLAYARGGKYNPQTISLSNFVEGALPIIQHILDPDIRVETDLPLDIMNVKVDRTQMQMVLSAIVANSNEAIDPPGRIRISARNMDLDKEFMKDHLGLTPGSYVCLSIEDDGKGMDEETRNRIFDPFFTTHFMGRGLGMASVYGIVKNHGGAITVDSELGKGTVVKIYLPAIEAKEAKEKVVLEAKVGLVGGKGTILVIEDEEPLLKMNRQILERLGYRVLEAMTGEEAVELAKTFDGQIDLALLDIKLPDIPGDKVYPLIMEARPNLKVIVCSGYAIDGPAQEILDAGAEGFVQKPFLISTLADKLKEVLEGK